MNWSIKKHQKKLFQKYQKTEQVPIDYFLICGVVEGWGWAVGDRRMLWRACVPRKLHGKCPLDTLSTRVL